MSWYGRCSMCRGRLLSQASAPAQAWLGMQWGTGLEGLGCMGIKNRIGSAWRCKGSIPGPLPRSGACDRPRALPRSLADSCMCAYNTCCSATPPSGHDHDTRQLHIRATGA